MAFPSFYAECAFNDGVADATAGNWNSRECFLRHGEVEPIGMHWYMEGRRSLISRVKPKAA